MTQNIANTNKGNLSNKTENNQGENQYSAILKLSACIFYATCSASLTVINKTLY